MKNKLTPIEIRIIECMAFQRAEDNYASGLWDKQHAKLFLKLVHNHPEEHIRLTEGMLYIK